MIVAIWIVAAFCLLLWSLCGWGLHAMFALVDAGRLAELKPMIENFPYGEKVSIWFPGWQDVLFMLIDLTQSLLGWLGGAAGTVVGVLWAIGALLLLGTAALVSLLVVLLREPAQKPAVATP